MEKGDSEGREGEGGGVDGNRHDLSKLGASIAYIRMKLGPSVLRVRVLP